MGLPQKLLTVALISIFAWGFSVKAEVLALDSPFQDVTSPLGQTEQKELPKLMFAPGLRVILKSKLGVVSRGEMRSISSDSALVIPDKSRLRNPDGVDYAFEKLQSLNVPTAELLWSEGDDPVEFVSSLANAEELTILNLEEFRLANQSKAPTPAEPPSAEKTTPEPTRIVMQPATNQTPDALRPTVEIICGNCMKPVSLASDSGQKCPHCGILWDTSPLSPEELAALKTAEDKARSANSAAPNFSGEWPMENAQASAEPNGQPAAAQPPIAQGGQPVAVPPPLQQQTAPQELTLETLPLWLKVTIFFACLGVMYYTFFYVR